jgi:hypothetical protein
MTGVNESLNKMCAALLELGTTSSTDGTALEQAEEKSA